MELLHWSPPARSLRRDWEPDRGRRPRVPREMVILRFATTASARRGRGRSVNDAFSSARHDNAPRQRRVALFRLHVKSAFPFMRDAEAGRPGGVGTHSARRAPHAVPAPAGERRRRAALECARPPWKSAENRPQLNKNRRIALGLPHKYVALVRSWAGSTKGKVPKRGERVYAGPRRDVSVRRQFLLLHLSP